MMKFFITLFFALFFPLLVTAQNLIQITPQEALEIGIKIWYNECAGTVSGLTSWNEGESFASVGIGHFIWYPYGKAHVYSDSFTSLLCYMQERGAIIPAWLQGNWTPYCPWNSRYEFLAAENSPQMVELREFLLRTISLQTEFMIQRMEDSLPRMINSMPPLERPYIREQISRIAATPLGVYALVDYVNFKGAGVTAEGNYDYAGWGLLEVLEDMKYAPTYMSQQQAFVWAANQVLTRRVIHEPHYRRDWIWLDGWRNRLKTYLG